VANVSYTPTFHHTEWLDNVDRVQAGGPNGFNTRFNTIETDLHGVATAVAQIDTALTALGTKPPPTQQRITLAPPLVADQPTPGWAHDASGVAVKPQNQTAISGLMSLNLPDRVRLLNLRAVGQNTGTNALVRISLFRAQLLGAGAAPDRLARVAGDANPFDNTVTVDPNLSTVDLGTFRYFIIATVDNAAPADIVTLAAIQLSYVSA